MARNKYPEETVKLILDVATHLFVEKGYDATSLQDIINETNLSKGAIYHHFSSKEEIFEAIFHRIGEENTNALAKVRDDKSLNGLEKLRAIFKAALFNSNQSLMLTVTPCLLDNPRFLAMQIAQLYRLLLQSSSSRSYSRGLTMVPFRRQIPVSWQKPSWSCPMYGSIRWLV